MKQETFTILELGDGSRCATNFYGNDIKNWQNDPAAKAIGQVVVKYGSSYMPRHLKDGKYYADICEAACRAYKLGRKSTTFYKKEL